MTAIPSILGLGVITDAFPSIQDFDEHAKKLAPNPLLPSSSVISVPSVVENEFGNTFQAAQLPDPVTLQQHDTLPQLALSAAHQALSMAGLITSAQPKLSTPIGEETALIVVSAWGAIDATVAYLDSMLDADGRYASPRHFSRSVYSSVASIAAIHFGIHGPCETLSFPDNPISATLHRARRLLGAGRCSQVLLIWADQTAEIVVDLTHRAATQLQKHQFDRYVAKNAGFGAVALILGHSDIGMPPLIIEESYPSPTGPSAPFPLNSALTLAQRIIRLHARPDKISSTQPPGETPRS